MKRTAFTICVILVVIPLATLGRAENPEDDESVKRDPLVLWRVDTIQSALVYHDLAGKEVRRIVFKNPNVFSSFVGIAVTPAEPLRVFLADEIKHTILSVDAKGAVTTLHVGALDKEVSDPQGLRLGEKDWFYIACSGNGSVVRFRYQRDGKPLPPPYTPEVVLKNLGKGLFDVMIRNGKMYITTQRDGEMGGEIDIYDVDRTTELPVDHSVKRIMLPKNDIGSGIDLDDKGRLLVCVRHSPEGADVLSWDGSEFTPLPACQLLKAPQGLRWHAGNIYVTTGLPMGGVLSYRSPCSMIIKEFTSYLTFARAPE